MGDGLPDLHCRGTLSEERALSDCPPDFVDLEVVLPQIVRVMGYGSLENFTGAPLPGYSGTRAWIHESCVASLQEIVEELAAQDFGLRLYDAYRPVRAVEAMMDWAQRENQLHLVDQGYLAPVSRHSKGCAVDVGLFELDTGRVLDMGTPWDAFDTKSHSDWGQGRVRENRLRLRDPFVKRGWRAARTEWWHFDREQEGLLPFDIPYG